MSPNVENAIEEPKGSWPDHSRSNSFIDLDIAKDYTRPSSSSRRPETKETGKRNAWGEANELQSNLRVEIGDRSFHLHNFPLISRSGKLNQLLFELRNPDKDRISLADIPGGAEAFENVVRFLYGKSVPLTSTNVAELRCAAEFLEMNDSVDDRSLVAKTEHYLNLVVVPSWSESIAVLRSCSDLKPWADELEIVRRCSESIAWKASTDPHGLRWSYSKSTGVRDAPGGWWFDDVCSLYIDTFSKVINAMSAKGVDSTTVAAVVVQYAEKWLWLRQDSKSSGFSHDDVASKAQIKNRAILQGIVSLLPSQSDSVSCKFLLKLLRAACAVNAGALCTTDLASRIGTQLEKVTVDELLIPANCAISAAMYDIDVVHQIVEHYLYEQRSGSPSLSSKSSAGQASISGGTSTTSVSSVTTTSSSDRSVSGAGASRTSISGSSLSRTSISGSSVSRTTLSMSDSSGSNGSTTTGTTSSSDESSMKLDSRFEKSKFFPLEGPTRRSQLASTSSNLRVAHLLENFLEEVAKYSSIPLGKFVAMADLFIEFPRESHDCVYRAVDTFLKSHPSLNDQERRKLCEVMDIQALSLNACMHAASNERLPVRVVVQVLFTEQVKLRNAVTGTAMINDKSVDSISASFSSSASRESDSVSTGFSSSSVSTNISTTTSRSNSTASGSSNSAYSLSIHGASPSAVSSLMPGGLNVKDSLRGALSEIELLRTAVQEIEMVKARLGFMDVLQQEMENITRKFMDLAHEYTGMTHQVEELTRTSKHKGGWTSGWKKMAKPFYSKDYPDPQKGFNSSLVLPEKNLKATVDAISLYPQMSILHPTDVPLLQNPKAPVQGAKAPGEAPKAVAAISEVETPLKVEAPKVETTKVPQAQAALEASPLTPALTVNGLVEQNLKDYQPPKPSFSEDYQPPRPSLTTSQPSRPSVSKNQSTRRSVSEESSQRHHKHPKTPDHRGNRGRHHAKDFDTVSVASDYSYSSAHSHRSRDTSSSHHHPRDGSEGRSHHSGNFHGHGEHRSHHRHRNGYTEHHRSSHHGDRSPDQRHRRSCYSPDHHHYHSKDPPRTSSAGNHKHEPDHHAGHHSNHSKPHHRSHHKHHHRKDYDSSSSYSSDSRSRPTKTQRHHSGV